MNPVSHTEKRPQPLSIESLRRLFAVSCGFQLGGSTVTITVQQLYGEIWGQEEAAFAAELTESLHPRPAEVLYELFAKTGLFAADTVLDAGCRDAVHAVELVHRYGCSVIGVDIVPQHIAKAQQRVAEAGLEAQITLHTAGIEALPLGDGVVHHIWCRDMLNHVDLRRGLAECQRVLTTGGRMLVYQTFATDRLEAQEAQRLYAALSIVSTNMAPAYFEATAAASGFVILEREPMDSEWREYWLEQGKTWAVEDLLTLARLRRREQSLVERFGRVRYEATYADALWGIYQMLGKLCPTVYLLEKGET
jgi:ubiquinone/menaquinone biosynthesis C-methylase UbiE